MVLPVFVRRLLLVAWDVASWSLAFLMFVWLRYRDDLTHEQWVSGVVYTAIAILLQAVAGLVTQSYLGRSRVGSFAEASFLGVSVGVIDRPGDNIHPCLSRFSQGFRAGHPCACTHVDGGRTLDVSSGLPQRTPPGHERPGAVGCGVRGGRRRPPGGQACRHVAGSAVSHCRIRR